MLGILWADVYWVCLLITSMFNECDCYRLCYGCLIICGQVCIVSSVIVLFVDLIIDVWVLLLLFSVCLGIFVSGLLSMLLKLIVECSRDVIDRMSDVFYYVYGCNCMNIVYGLFILFGMVTWLIVSWLWMYVYCICDWLYIWYVT